MRRFEAETNSDSEALQPERIVRFQRHFSRQLVSVAFILFAAAWLLYTGARLKLRPKAKMATCLASRMPFTLNAKGTATGLLIFLHGLGDNGNGWCQAFDCNKQKDIRYVFPNAGSMPVSLNMGMVMPSWFDITSLDMKGDEDEKGIKKAAEELRALIKTEQENTGVPSERVILGGFSMGGSLALYTALTHQETLGGLILLSSWLPLRNSFKSAVSPRGSLSLTKQRCPVFQGHGDIDPLVLHEYGKETYNLVNDARKADWKTDTDYTFKTYHIGHSQCDEEMDDVNAFVKRVFSQK